MTNQTVNEVKWIAIYTRKSNDENLIGEVTSINNQKTCCRSYIEIQKEKGWREYHEAFDDPAESGKDLKRPSIQKLLKAVREEKVQGIIVYKLDRLTRNSKDFHSLLELFEKHNVAFISATESIDTKSPQGRLMTAIMVQFAQYDREMDVERSQDMHLARARKGFWSAGLAPLGYDLKEKLLVINEKEAQLIRRIFDLYLKHGSTLQVLDEINRLGFRRKIYRTKDNKSYGGKPFNPDSIIRILRRKIYIGFVTNKRTGQDFPGQHKTIITPAVFERVQKLLNTHNKRDHQIAYVRNKYSFRLKGLVRCGECQSAVASYARPKKGKVYLYYKCLAKQNGISAQCAFKSIGAQKLEEYVIEKLASVGYNQNLLERVVQKVDKLTRAGVKSLEKERRELEEQLKSIGRDTQNLISVVKDGSSNRQASDELEKLEAAKRELEAKLGEFDAQIAFRKQAVYDADVIAGTLQRFARFIYRIPLPLQVQAIRLLVRQVTVYKGRVNVGLHKLPVSELDRALDNQTGGNGGGKFKSRLPLRRLGQFTTKKPVLPQLGDGTAVAELGEDWRGRRDLDPRSSA